MDLPTVLLRDLRQLSSSVGLDDNALGGPLVSLVEGLQWAVPSFRGLHVTVVDLGHPVSLTAFVPHQDSDSITTSLRVGFAALDPGFDGESSVVFYAATSGAFVDLAADLEYALTPIITASTPARSTDSTDRQHSRGQTDGDRQHADQLDGDGQHGPSHSDQHQLFVLDADLPPPTTRSGLSGLAERSMIDQAIGVMLDQGHHPDGAYATLRSQAAAAGVEPHIYAGRLLRD